LTIRFETLANGRVRALTRFRDHDGRLRRVTATGETQKSAERNLKELLADRIEQNTGSGELTASSTFRHLVEIWLADLDLEDKLAPSTRALYERNMEKLVLPAFENYLLREISVRKVDQFIKTLAATKSYSTAKQAKTVLSLAFGLAVRYDALQENPVRDIAKMRKPPSQAMALTIDQVDEIRAAVRGWRRGPGFAGPPPDGQLEQIIEVMLGTSARIGEVLAIRKCDVDVTMSPARVRICGTIVSPSWQADASAAPPQDGEVDPRGRGAELHRRDPARAARGRRAGGSRSPAVLQPEPHSAHDQQRAPTPAEHSGRGRHHRGHTTLIPPNGRHRPGPCQRCRPGGRDARPHLVEDHQAALHRARRVSKPGDGRDPGVACSAAVGRSAAT
jgi:integrase